MLTTKTFGGIEMSKKIFVLVAILLVISAWTYTKLNAEPESIILSTTTSTQDSGLLDFILPEFTEEQKLDIMFRFIQYIERHIFSFDSWPAKNARFHFKAFGINALCYFGDKKRYGSA